MPQADLYFTADQSFPPVETLEAIEAVIQGFDPNSGFCKGRAHRIADFNHSHIFLTVSMLQKPHRDENFASELGGRLASALEGLTSPECVVNVLIRFDLVYYATAPAR